MRTRKRWLHRWENAQIPERTDSVNTRRYTTNLIQKGTVTQMARGLPRRLLHPPPPPSYLPSTALSSLVVYSFIPFLLGATQAPIRRVNINTYTVVSRSSPELFFLLFASPHNGHPGRPEGLCGEAGQTTGYDAEPSTGRTWFHPHVNGEALAAHQSDQKVISGLSRSTQK